jgi:hypothetical protein
VIGVVPAIIMIQVHNIVPKEPVTARNNGDEVMDSMVWSSNCVMLHGGALSTRSCDMHFYGRTFTPDAGLQE